MCVVLSVLSGGACAVWNTINYCQNGSSCQTDSEGVPFCLYVQISQDHSLPHTHSNEIRIICSMKLMMHRHLDYLQVRRWLHW